MPVAIRRLDALVGDGTVPRPDVIKMDIEGNELRAMRGGCSIFDREDAPIVVYEANLWAAPIATGEPATAATHYLLGLARPRYQCFFIWSWGLVTRLEPNQIVHGDIIAIPAAKVDRWASLVSRGFDELVRLGNRSPASSQTAEQSRC